VVEGGNVVVYEMTLKEWQIKIVQPSPVAAIALNSSGNILFVADGAGIHVSLIKGPDLDRPKVTKRALTCSYTDLFLGNGISYRYYCQRCNPYRPSNSNSGCGP
jgi:ABC-type uncharacterized transport system permease subunit